MSQIHTSDFGFWPSDDLYWTLEQKAEIDAMIAHNKASGTMVVFDADAPADDPFYRLWAEALERA